MNYDVVICGAGLIGFSLAKALSQAGISCALIEQRSLNIDLSSLSDSYSNRVSAITHKSQAWLEQIGIWQTIKPYACAYQNMYVYDGEGTGHISFKAEHLPNDNLGHIVENVRIIDALNQLPSTLEVFENTKVLSFSEPTLNTKEESEGYLQTKPQKIRQVVLDNGQTISCQLIIGADSKQSTIREIAKLDTRFWSYDQSAIVATVKVKKSTDTLFENGRSCWQNFTFCGPLAFLPIYNKSTCHSDYQYYSIVWSVDHEHLDGLLEKSLIEQLKLHAPAQLGQLIEVTDQAQFDLTAHHCHEYTKQGLAIIGDAAHSIHPLAGQGANLGFSDAQKLFEIIVDAKANNINLGNHVILKRFERDRKLKNIVMQATMEGFKRGFQGQNPIKVLLRNQAMNATNYRIFPKSWIMSQALSQ